MDSNAAYLKLFEQIARHAKRFYHPDPDSFAQEICLEIFASRGVEGWEQDGGLAVWRARKRLIDYRRQAARLPRLRTLTDRPEETRQVSRRFDARDSDAQLLRHLTPRAKAILMDKHGFGATDGEIAGRYGISVTAVRSSNKRSRKMLVRMKEFADRKK